MGYFDLVECPVKGGVLQVKGGIIGLTVFLLPYSGFSVLQCIFKRTPKKLRLLELDGVWQKSWNLAEKVQRFLGNNRGQQRVMAEGFHSGLSEGRMATRGVEARSHMGGGGRTSQLENGRRDHAEARNRSVKHGRWTPSDRHRPTQTQQVTPRQAKYHV